MAIETSPRPFFLMEKSSPLEMRSSPNTNPMRLFLTYATGTRARAFMPIRPSARKSTESPVTKAIIIAATVEIFSGRQRIIIGRMLRVMYGVTWK